MTVNDKLSEPPAGMLSGVFAPEVLNPAVVELTEFMWHDRMKLPLLMVNVSCTDWPVFSVNPEKVCPLVPQALSLEVMLTAVTSTVFDCGVEL